MNPATRTRHLNQWLQSHSQQDMSYPALHGFLCARLTGPTAHDWQGPLAWLLPHLPNVLLIPGTSMLAHLEENMGAADVVLVVWPAAAAPSAEVGSEWRQALAAGRRVVPVVTDAAPVPGELGALQWVQSPGCGV